jgi:3-oxoacyl-[acyl-carrier protein] reductase
MDLGIAGKSAIVTGGSKGIGYQSAKRLLEAGVRVTVCARDEKRLAQARQELSASGEVHAVPADMAKPQDIERLVAQAAKRFGPVDILFNNAGQMSMGRFAEVSEEMLQKQLDIKLYGFMRAMRLVYPMMKERGWGRIVNTIGGAGKEPQPASFGSNVSNAALLSLTKTVSMEWAKDGITVNAICPGYVETENWVRNAARALDSLGAKDAADLRDKGARQNAMNRFGRPEELAPMVAFLCSEHASYITGISVNIDGGRLKSLW